MAVRRYYLAPWVTLYAIGAGQFSLTDPGGARVTSGSRVLIHGRWQSDVTGHRSETIKPSSGRGRGKGTCVTWAEAPDVDSLSLHANVAADTEIAAVPWTPENLDSTFGTLTAQQQADVRAYLASIFLDDQWIAGATTFRAIMAYALHVMFAAQQLGDLYPDGPLSARWNSLSGAQQAELANFASVWGLTLPGGNPEVRELVAMLASADYGAGGRPTLGNVEFGPWQP